MRAVRLDEYGPAENFKIVDVPIPDPGELHKNRAREGQPKRRK